MEVRAGCLSNAELGDFTEPPFVKETQKWTSSANETLSRTGRWFMHYDPSHRGHRMRSSVTRAAMDIAADKLERKSQRPLRYFFLGMACLAIAIIILAFVPEYKRFAGGTFPIACVVHVHAALMAGWVAAFVIQACLGATDRTVHYHRFGRYAVAMGWLAWAWMIFVEFRTFVVYPLPHDPRGLDWELPGPHVYLTFAIFLAWAVYERRWSASHKRLMTFALFVLLAAAIERFNWIPMDFGFVPLAALLDACLLFPLIAYDVTTLKWRLHPATVRGGAPLLISQGLLFALWGTSIWHYFAFTVAKTFHTWPPA